MIALQILEKKQFMSKLLKEEMFHHFLLVEATVINGVTYSLDGKIAEVSKKDFPEEFPFSFILYEKAQPKIFEMVKGSYTPSYMKLIFSLTPENIQKTIASANCTCDPDTISGMYINVVFQGDQLLVTTGVSYGVFVKDRTLEQEWDRFVKLFFTKNNLGFELMS